MRIVRTDNDFVTSVHRALKEIDKDWEKYPGLIVVGSHSPDKVPEKLAALREARESGLPTLGICLGMQLMAIEFARTSLNCYDANSEELGRGAHVVKRLPELRVGAREVAGRLESHWHNFAFNRDWEERFAEEGWEFTHADGIVEVMRLEDHPFYVGTQFHPEYGSSKKDKHPILKAFLEACKRHD